MSNSLEIARYHSLLEQGAITQEEYEEKKTELLRSENQISTIPQKSTDILPRLLDDYPHWFLYLCIWLGIIWLMGATGLCFISWRESRVYLGIRISEYNYFDLPGYSFEHYDFYFPPGFVVNFALSLSFLICVFSPLLSFARKFSMLSQERIQGQGIFTIIVSWIGIMCSFMWPWDWGVGLIAGFLILLYGYVFRIRRSIHRHMSHSGVDTPLSISVFPLLFFHVIYLKYKIDQWHKNF